MIVADHSRLSSREIPPNKKRPLTERAFQKGGDYVRSVTIRVSVTKVSITIQVGDETIVIEVPIIASADQY